MTGTELKAYVAELLDGRTDLATSISRSITMMRRMILAGVRSGAMLAHNSRFALSRRQRSAAMRLPRSLARREHSRM